MASDLIIIGGGPAGVEAALTAAPHANTVKIVSSGPVADWSKMISSRVWLTALEQIAASANSPLIQPAHRLGYNDFDISLVAAHVKRVRKSWQDYVGAELKKKKVSLTVGQAAFHSPHQLVITNDSGQQQQLVADSIIIASGSIPYFPAGLEPDADRVFSPATIDQLSTLPKSIMVIGDGPIGFEFVDLFSQLGMRVSWLVLEGGPKCGFDLEVDEFLLDLFEQRDVQIEAGASITRLERGKNVVALRTDGTQLAAEMAFVNVGHRPNRTGLNLQAAGLESDEHGLLKSDEFGRTNIPHIYVVGGAVRFGAGNVAMALARVAALHATKQQTEPFDFASSVIYFGLDPQLPSSLLRCAKKLAVGYAASLLNDYQLAEDAAQEAFISAYLNLHQLHDTEAFPGWFRQIVRSQCGRIQRRASLPVVDLQQADQIVDDTGNTATRRRHWKHCCHIWAEKEQVQTKPRR